MNELPDNLKKASLVIANPPVRNRIKNEILKILNSGFCDSNDISINSVTDSDSNNYCLIYINNVKNKKIYKFNITSSYPYLPPKLEIQLYPYIEFKPYNYYLNFHSLDFKNKLYKHKGTKCFCCYTKICPENWTPTITFLDVINETIHYHNVCREIADRVMVDVIKRKYLIDDIDIITWLYH